MTPKVSVNITTRNRAALVPRCLESVMEQSYRNLEINIIDDASTDSTCDVLEGFRKTDARVNIFRSFESRGNAASRNALLEKTTGDMIAFLDDDDYWIDPEKLEKQVDRISRFGKKQAVIVCTQTMLETAAGVVGHSVTIPSDTRRAILVGNGFIFNSTVLTTRHTLALTGGFDEQLPRGVDSEFYRCAILDHQAIVDLMDDVTTIYRTFGSRMTTRRTIQERKNILRAHLHIISKHRADFLRYPGTLFKRFIRMGVSMLR